MMSTSKTRTWILSVYVGMLLLVPAVSFAQTDEQIETLRETSRAFTAVSKSAIPAVVAVNVKKTVKVGGGFQNPFFDEDFFERFFGRPAPEQQPRERKQQGIGSGFIVTRDGYALTNNHVVEGADEITVTLHDGSEKDAKLVGTDPRTDVAVLKLEGDDFPYIDTGDSDTLDIGEWVIAVGNPFGLEATVTVGVVSAKGRGANITEYDDFIQTDAAINPGNSGGPLLNIDGKAVGINTAIVSRSGGYMGIGFAIPINMARDIMEQLIATGKVTRGYIGIYMKPVDAKVAEFLGIGVNEGVEVSDVVEDSPAEEAGVKAGDIILELNGEKITDIRRFKSDVAGYAPGTKVKLTVHRSGGTKQITVKLGSLEESAFAVETETDQMGEPYGIKVKNLTPEIAEQFGYKDKDGVVITDVAAGSSADEQNLKPGMLIARVNNEDVKTVAEFNKVVKEAKDGRILLLINDGRGSRLVVLTTEKE